MKKIKELFLFFISIVLLIISVGETWSSTLWTKEFGIIVADYVGGEIWVKMDLLRIALIFLTCIFSFIILRFRIDNKKIKLIETVLNFIMLTFLMIALYISMRIMYNYGIFSDEINMTNFVFKNPKSIIFWHLMNWLRLPLLAISCIVLLFSGINLLFENKD